jgi:hypothetical protein
VNKTQPVWAEGLLTINFDLFNRKGSSHLKPHMLSWSLAFTSKAGGTTAAENPTFLTKE